VTRWSPSPRDLPVTPGSATTGPPSAPSGDGGGLARSGRVLATVGGVYTVELEDGRRVEASLRGRLKKDARRGDRVVIGDVVQVESVGDAWVVEGVEDRTSSFVRKGPGGRHPKVLVANLDHLFVVMAARDPDPHPEVLDRFLVAAEASGMHPRIVMNKVELEGARTRAEELAALYGAVGYETLLTSAVSGEGIDALIRALGAGTAALVGPSGAGKSTLLNAVDPELELRTGALSRKTGRGRHTTVNARLLELSSGGRVADTPGFGEVGIWGVDAEELDACFPEMEAYRGTCRFRGCTHLHEPGCAVRAAVEEGTVAPSRYASYRSLMEEAQAEPRW